MRVVVLDGRSGGSWDVGPRSAAELKEAAAHYEQVRFITSVHRACVGPRRGTVSRASRVAGVTLFILTDLLTLTLTLTLALTLTLTH
eukprot:scaffold24420_cov66-Phaeocystis_antarctica.AAC.1